MAAEGRQECLSSTSIHFKHLTRGTRSAADIPSLLLYGGAGLLGFFAVYQLIETYVLSPRLGDEQLHLLHIVRGITASLLLATFVASYLIRHPTILHRFDEARGTTATPPRTPTLNSTTFGKGTLSEACATCHGVGKDWDVAKMHAR